AWAGPLRRGALPQDSQGCPFPAVLLRLRTLEEERIGGTSVCDRAMERSARHHEQVASAQVNRALSLELDAERALPAQEQLVLVVGMPRELALAADHADNRVVDIGQ